ncbi:MAG: acetyl-CoA C-acetyltransferase [Gammaproteobacteria bacterium]|jgi:acetyl-CoA C-acetyltransferase
MSTRELRRVAIIGGTRTPFCRSNTLYEDLTNLDLLSTALQGLVDRFDLASSGVDELYAGAVTTHAKDWNLAREAALSTSLPANVPAVTIMQACATSLQAAMIIAAKIAAGHIDSGIAAGSDTTSDAPMVLKRRLAQRLLRFARARTPRERLRLIGEMRITDLVPQPPSPAEPRTGLSMGEHCELMAREWNIGREAQDAFALDSHTKAAAAYAQGLLDESLVPCAGVWRDNNVRADSDMQKLGALRTAFRRDERATLTAGNSTPLTDGASAVLLASEEWAQQHGLPILAYLTHAQSAAVDFVTGDGLLMAPTIAMGRMLERADRTLDSFDVYEIHEAFAAQVLCTLKAWEDPAYCRDRLGLPGDLGSIDPARLNPRGSSLAYGHPFAATGARVLTELAMQLENKPPGASGVVSVCTAGGMGVTAIVER